MSRPPPGFVASFQTARDAYEEVWKDPLTPTERRVFFAIAMHPGISNPEIAEKLEAKSEQVSRAIGKLVPLGWVIARDAPGDRRVRHFGMSPRGMEEIVRTVRAIHGNMVDASMIKGVHIWNPDEEGSTD